MPSETVELRGHIIDSLILPKVLDQILTNGGNFKIDEIKIGQNRADQSFARIDVSATSREALNELMLRLRQHGAAVVEKANVQLGVAPADGVFPADFYVTTNQQTFVRVGGKELEVTPPMRDCGIHVDRKKQRAITIKFSEVKRGMEIVAGHKGVRVAPLQRSTSRTDAFEFITTSISGEQPKSAVIRETAREFKRVRAKGGKIVLVAGPAVVHTGAAEHLEQLIDGGYVDVLLAGNALAVHDIENALFGTSLGMNLDRGALADRGHENQMRAINTIRGLGGIAKAVQAGVLQKGIMHACVRKGVTFLLAGSIRDEGPLPEVMTDSLEAQRAIREKIEGASIALMMATTLHSMAVASLLPAGVRTLCVDLNPAAVSKLTDPRNFQALGLVTDVELFLRELVGHLAETSDNGASK